MRAGARLGSAVKFARRQREHRPGRRAIWRRACCAWPSQPLRRFWSGSTGQAAVGDRCRRLRRREIAGRRYHQRRALAVVDAWRGRHRRPGRRNALDDSIMLRRCPRRPRPCASRAAVRRRRLQQRPQRDRGRPASLGRAVRMATIRCTPNVAVPVAATPAANSCSSGGIGALLRRDPRRDSYKSPITPATMAASARLNTYQMKLNAGVVMWNSTKSATAP